MTRTSIAVVFASLALLGCEKQPEPTAKPPAGGPTATPAPAAPAHSAAPAPTGSPAAAAANPHGGIELGSSVNVMGLSFKVPEGWKQGVPSNNMRLAEISAPDASGDASKACVAAFSTAGGDVNSNLTRWANQVHDASGQPVKAEPKHKTVAGLPVHTVELTGSYVGMGDGSPMADWTLRAAIVETPSGLLFIKMTGPKDKMAGTAAGFDALVDSMTKK